MLGLLALHAGILNWRVMSSAYALPPMPDSIEEPEVTTAFADHPSARTTVRGTRCSGHNMAHNMMGEQ